MAYINRRLPIIDLCKIYDEWVEEIMTMVPLPGIFVINDLLPYKWFWLQVAPSTITYSTTSTQTQTETQTASVTSGWSANPSYAPSSRSPSAPRSFGYGGGMNGTFGEGINSTFGGGGNSTFNGTMVNGTGTI